MKVSDLRSRRAPWSGLGISALVGVLLCLGALNIAIRAKSHDVEDGVRWVSRTEGVVAADIADDSPAALAGIRSGDLLLALDGAAVETPSDVAQALHRGATDTRLTYTLLRLGRQEMLSVQLAPTPGGNLPLYFVLSAIGIFTLLVGASVRLRRPGDPATLHFFWLCLAFFGTFTFSFSGRLDRLDWFFYWADAVAVLLLAPLFLHFTLVFPERSGSWVRTSGRMFLPVLYLPALAMGTVRVIAVARVSANAPIAMRAIQSIDRLEPLYLSVCMVGGLMVLVRALTRVRSVTARRQLRWIVWGTALGAGPFAVGYALPYAAGAQLSLPMELSVIPLSLVPLAFASAIIRYRLMDVEVIVKRSLVYTAVVLAVLTIYTTLFRLVGVLVVDDLDRHNRIVAVLATLVVVLLARPVKNAIQNALDRAFYRDRYDYRRALVGFARDLNSDLDLARLSERLVARVRETFLVDRMALMLSEEASGECVAIRAEGFDDMPPPALSRGSMMTTRLAAGQSLALDDPRVAEQFHVDELATWRECGVHYFVPCASKGRLIATLALGRRDSGEPLNSEDAALLLAVGSQVATALENGRLYRQLQLKAEELQRLREFNENIVESLDDGLVVVDLDGRVVRWNRAMERLYGLAPADVAGHRLEDLFDGPFVEGVRAAQRDAPGGASLYRVPLAGRSGRSGERLRVNVAVAPLQAPDEGSAAPVTVGSIIIVEDVTERVHLEEQLQISDKMASVGVLAAGVAHEVNTPLTGISSFTQMLLQNADPEDPKTRLLEKIEQQTFRAAKIVNGLLNLSRSSGPAAVERGPVDLNAVISDVLALLEPQLIAGKIKVRRELCATPALVLGVEHKLQQVFLNLFLNARDAMPKGGWLSVGTSVDDGQVMAEIGDTGSGIPNEHLSRIYDPFFTTKAMGKGTGLGLSITYGIIREHEGTISCQSAIGQGTQFTMSLPRTATASQRSGRASS
jgi:two-component system, NtrC family, sensor kinase